MMIMDYPEWIFICSVGKVLYFSMSNRSISTLEFFGDAFFNCIEFD